MSLILFLLLSAAILWIAYRVMGNYLSRWLGLDPSVETPALRMKDGLDFEPIRASALFPQHFSAIAAAGPIVGPILAGKIFGWFPTYLWIIIGSILIGGIHDLTTLVASIRHEGRSIAEIVRRHMNRRAYLLFLLFVWISLIYVIIAFADVTAGAFVDRGNAAHASAPGPAVASSSLIYLALAIAMGLALRFTGLRPGTAKAIFLPLVVLAIVAGPSLPLDLASLLPGVKAQKAWNVLLLGYCFIASIVPVWLLLQPRGELGGYFLYLIVVVGIAGIFVGGLTGALDIASPAITAAPLVSLQSGGLPPLFPILFITVACGACSGFHSIVTSGTTSKQLSSEADARPVAYGSMLLEAFFACISLATVMIMVVPEGTPNTIYANGVAQFFHHATFGFLTVQTAYQFALLCFATFVFDTLDAATRLARYILMELTGWAGRTGMVLATATTLALPLVVVTLPPAMMNGKEMPLWQVFWNLFGSSNQLLAALALMAVSVWLARTGRKAFLPAGGAIFMLVMTLWSLGLTVRKQYGSVIDGTAAGLTRIEFMIALVLIALSGWLIGEAVMALRPRSPLAAEREEAAA